jgi:hypothetical protein
VNSVEDQVRAATRAQADVLREVRPLQLPAQPAAGHGLSPAARPRRARRIKIWIAPLAAAAAVVALVTGTLIIRNISNAPVVPAAPTAIPPGTAGVPEYYMALPIGDNAPGATTAVFGNTFTGQKLLSVHAFGADEFVSVMAAADDRTFVLGGGVANPKSPGPTLASDWYAVHVSLTPTPSATIRKLAITLPAGLVPAGTALSPDGRELAISTETTAGSRDGKATDLVELRVYSVTTGALLNSWSGTVPGANAVIEPNAPVLSWTADGKQMAFGYTYSVAGQLTRTYLAVGLLALDRPGHDLIANSRRVWSEEMPDIIPSDTPLSCEWLFGSPVVVAPDGETLICGAATSNATLALPYPGHKPGTCLEGQPPTTVAFLEYSTASGRLLRPVYSERSNCAGEPLDILWTTSSGDKMMGYIADLPVKSANHRTIPGPAFGVFSAGKFTRLPKPPTITMTAIAW